MKHSVIITCLLLFISTAYAYSIEMNFAFHLGSDKNDTIHVNGTNYLGNETYKLTFTELSKKYVSSEDNENNVVAALVFAGSSFLSVMINTTYSSTDYLLQMTQDSEDNGLLFAFTKGRWSDIDDDVLSVKTILGTMFGVLSYTKPSSFVHFLRLEFTDINLTSKLKWGSGAYRLYISNQGDDARGNPKVSMELSG